MPRLSSILRWAGGMGLPLLVAACINVPPMQEPGNEAVFKAARDVIAARYPNCLWSEENGYLLARTPVTLDGHYKTRKMISVLVRQTYLGHEPIVRVTRLVDIGEPALKNNPEAPLLSYRITDTIPFAENEWLALDYAKYEEQEIYDAILARLYPAPTPAPSQGI
jgi:hypothetical protein